MFFTTSTKKSSLTQESDYEWNENKEYLLKFDFETLKEIKHYHQSDFTFYPLYPFTTKEVRNIRFPITEELRNIQSFLLNKSCCCDQCNRSRLNTYKMNQQSIMLCDDDWCWSKNDDSFKTRVDRKTRKFGKYKL